MASKKLKKLTPEEQARQMDIVERILKQLKEETPEQAQKREREYANLFYTLPEDKFWEYYNDRYHWEDAMSRRVRAGLITEQEILSWFGNHPVKMDRCQYDRAEYDIVKEFASGDCLTGFGGVADGLSRAQIKRMLWALRTGVPTKRWIRLKTNRISRWRCHQCGQLMQWETNGITLRLAKDACECQWPEGFKAFTTVLRVPSGKIAYNDYFHSVDVAPERDSYDSSKQNEFYRVTDYNAKHQGFATMGFCGNSCPAVWANAERTRISVGNSGYTTDEKTYEDHITAPIMPTGEQVGSICTNAWEYALVDLDYLKSVGGSDDRCDGILDVKPGLYLVSHHGHYINRDAFRTARIYADLEWIGDC